MQTFFWEAHFVREHLKGFGMLWLEEVCLFEDMDWEFEFGLLAASYIPVWMGFV